MRFHVDIVSSESRIYSGQSDEIIVPTQQGELGIYARHAPLIGFLKPGFLRIFLGKKEKHSMFVSSGFIEVQPHVVTILSDLVIRSEEFDAAAAKAARYIGEHKNEINKQAINKELALQIKLYRMLGDIKQSKKGL